MTGEERRIEILNVMRSEQQPVSGAALAKQFHVSRQAIVQDIALLRAAHYNIYSTARGYQLIAGVSQPAAAERTEVVNYRIFRVRHSDAEIEDELNLIVDNGGKVIDVFIHHEVYGAIRGELNVKCRRNVREFMEGIKSGKSSPLKNLTSGVHYHTVEADSEFTLDYIEAELKQRGYLCEE